MEILVRKAIDRSKHPKAMLYVDGQGNICKADKPSPLSEDERASRQEARDVKYRAYLVHKQKLNAEVAKAKKQARKDPTVANAEVLGEVKERYENFKQVTWRKYEG